MKLLLCTNYNSIFNITTITKTCACGLTSGKYLDGIEDNNAVYSGRFAVPLKVYEKSFVKCLGDYKKYKSNLAIDFLVTMVNKDNTSFKLKEDAKV